MLYLVLLVLILPVGTWIGCVVIYYLTKDKVEDVSLEEDYYENLHLYSEAGFFNTIKKDNQK